MVLATPAMAADLPVKARMPAPPAVYNWSGCYIGIQGGAIWQRADNSFSVSGADPFAPDGSANGTGAIVGGHLGCNWQQSHFVFGLEGDANWSNVKGNDGGIGGDINELSMRWMATIRGRLGYTLFSDRSLTYITGGVAWAGAQSSVLDPGEEESIRRTIVGWTLGLGNEFAITDNLSGRIEGRYYDFGRQDFRLPINGYTERHDNVREWTLMVGLTYRFSGALLGH